MAKLLQDMIERPGAYLLIAAWVVATATSLRLSLFLFARCWSASLSLKCLWATLGSACLVACAYLHVMCALLLKAAVDWAAEDLAYFYGGLLIGTYLVLFRKPLGRLLRALTTRVKELRPAEPKPQRVGFWDRVWSYLVGHMLFSLITGTIGLWGIIKYACYVLATVLALAGWEVTPPDSVKEETRGMVATLKEKFHDKKEDALERLREERDELKDRLDDGRERLKERYREEKRKVFWWQ